MKIYIDTNEYQRSHGKAPRGSGAWAFEINGEQYIVKDAKSYNKAKKEAVKIAKERKAYSVVVLP